MAASNRLFHVMFTTKGCELTIAETVRTDFNEYISGIINRRRCTAHAVNAFFNHVHIIIELPPRADLHKMVNKIKAYAGNMLMQSGQCPDFVGWTPKYEAAQIFPADLADLIDYVNNQAAPHESLSVDAEIARFFPKDK